MPRRILVALDSRDLSAQILEVATRLAAERQAELVALYVEDTTFLTAADLPFSKALRLQGGGWESLDPQVMERAFRARAQELRGELASRAARLRLAWTFQTTRGVPAQRLLEAAGEAELVVLGRSNRGRGARLGGTARRAVRECAASVLLVGGEGAVPQRVTAFFDGREPVLEAAAELTALHERPLEVAVLGGNDEQYAARAAQARTWLRAHGQPVHLRRLDSENPRKVAAALRESGPGLAVVGADSDIGEVDLAELLDELDCPVLVVRGR